MALLTATLHQESCLVPLRKLTSTKHSPPRTKKVEKKEMSEKNKRCSKVFWKSCVYVFVEPLSSLVKNRNLTQAIERNMVERFSYDIYHVLMRTVCICFCKIIQNKCDSLKSSNLCVCLTPVQCADKFCTNCTCFPAIGLVLSS